LEHIAQIISSIDERALWAAAGFFAGAAIVFVTWLVTDHRKVG
jgi:hypothetical protein